MSQEIAERFFEEVEKNKSLQAKLAKATDECRAREAADVVKIASAAGFQFTAKDFEQVRKAKAKKMLAAALPEVAGQDSCLQYTWNCPTLLAVR